MYIEDEYLDKRQQKVDASAWTTHVPRHIPHQLNCSDCGVFMVTFADFEVRVLSCEGHPGSPLYHAVQGACVAFGPEGVSKALGVAARVAGTVCKVLLKRVV